MATSRTAKEMKDIKDILKLASRLGVSSLKFGELEVEFDRNTEGNFRNSPAKSVGSKVKPVSEDKFKALTKEAELRDRLEQIEEDSETFHAEDPFMFEQLLSQKELVDAEENS